MDNAHGGLSTQRQTEPVAPGRSYLFAAVAIAILTVIAVGLAYTHGAPRDVVVVILMLMAAAGVALELLYFMHLRVAPERRLFFLFFGAGLGFALLMAIVLTVLLQIVIPASA